MHNASAENGARLILMVAVIAAAAHHDAAHKEQLMNNIEEFEAAYNTYMERDVGTPVEKFKYPVPGVTYKYQHANDMLAFWNAARVALIAQLESAQKLISEDGKLQYIRRLEAEKQTEANTINLQRRMNLELMTENAELKERVEKAEAELSAANEKLSKPVEFHDCDIGAVSHMAHWYSEKQCEAWVAGVEFSKKQIIKAGFTVEGE
ncbi:hypothetical protein [Yersinia rochesterensis]|uniref:hypothetical protein n=1 Tax=Yersinia rochesterensis TaxID=1604335 RepID=UPI001643BA41|nr:hypothetical protein [Yersinia rochesterensis]